MCVNIISENIIGKISKLKHPSIFPLNYSNFYFKTVRETQPKNKLNI